MSVFAQSLKTFTSDITGEEREYKINNAIWVILKGKFGISQHEFSDKSVTDENIYSAKFVAAVMQANGMKVTEKEINENVDHLDLLKFINQYLEAVSQKTAEIFSLPGKDDEEEEEEGK